MVTYHMKMQEVQNNQGDEGGIHTLVTGKIMGRMQRANQSLYVVATPKKTGEPCGWDIDLVSHAIVWKTKRLGSTGELAMGVMV
jgi:hypothetical protein